MNECEEIKTKLKGYIEGTLERDEMSRLESHLKECAECGEQLERLENSTFLNGNKKPAEVYDVRKIESSFTRKIIGKVIGITAFIVIAFYMVFGMVLPAVFNSAFAKKSEEIGYAVKDLVQFTIPGVRLKGGYEGTVTLLDMVKVVEYEQMLVGGGLKTGKIDLAVPLYAGRNDWKFINEENRQGSGYVFFYPQKRSGSSIDMTWEKLEKIGEGTKTVAALYFESPVTTDDMQRILEKIEDSNYNTWLAIDTGDAVAWEYGMGKPYRELQMFSPQWGFPMNMQLTPTTATDIKKDSTGRIISMGWSGMVWDVPGAAERFKREMKDLQAYSSKYFDADEFTGDLAKINAYIDKNGIMIKGAIVGSSTENILKLRDEQNIARVDIVKVDFDY